MRITPDVEQLIDQALAEDLGAGDATTEALISPEQRGRAVVVPRAPGVLAGIEIVAAVFRRVDPGLELRLPLEDGAGLTPQDPGTGREGDVIAEVRGAIASVLKAERTALNFLQHLSGVATATRAYVEAVEGYPVRILDTRKTIPGLRSLEKYAVRVGGGHNHRRGLGDGILVKDNHVEALRVAGLSLGQIVERARENASHTLKVEIEVENLDQAREALDAGAEVLLLDNMGVEEMAVAVRLARGRALTEASGGITLDNVRGVASTGVDMVSIGALTHSVNTLDVSLDFVHA